MDKKNLHVALVIFSLWMFIPAAHADVYGDENLAYEDNSYYPAEEESIDAEPMAVSERMAYYDNYDSGGYDNDGYSDNYSSNNYQRPYHAQYAERKHSSHTGSGKSYSSRLPQTIASSEKMIVVDPRVHAWGAYQDGRLIKSGLATAGSRYCRDIHRPCKTRAGVFRIQSLGSQSCKSTRYPVGRGGAPMPYCMYFNGNQGLHGSYEVVEGNVSHGCVRMTVSDAAWVRFNFANIGTKVIVRSY